MRRLAGILCMAALCGCGDQAPGRLQSMDAWRDQGRSALPKGFDARLRAAPADQGRSLYQQHCLACHGAGGAGDGPLAAGLKPPPADLRREALESTAADIYGDISQGVSGTAMSPWQDRLSEDERIALSAQVKRLAPGRP